jgi:hypothetical protein
MLHTILYDISSQNVTWEKIINVDNFLRTAHYKMVYVLRRDDRKKYAI